MERDNEYNEYSDRPTMRCPPGRPCGALFCGSVAIAGTDRCERHKPTVRMNAVVLEAFTEACR